MAGLHLELFVNRLLKFNIWGDHCFSIDNKSVARVMSTLIANDMSAFSRNHIYDSAFAFIAPLCTHHY